jgi:hypothetical protein
MYSDLLKLLTCISTLFILAAAMRFSEIAASLVVREVPICLEDI